MGTAALIASAAIAATGSVVSYEQQKHASEHAQAQQQHANAIAQASSAVEAAHRRRQAIAHARVIQAQNIASQGYSSEGSALSGVNSELSTQTQANIGFANAQNRSNQDIFNLHQQAYNTEQQGQLNAGLTSGIANSISSGLNNYAAITK